MSNRMLIASTLSFAALLTNVPMVGQRAAIDSGYVRDKIYYNSFLGLTFRPTPAMDLKVEPERSDRGATFVLVRAFGKREVGRITSVMILSADKLVHEANFQGNAGSYLDTIVEDQKANGYSLRHRGEESMGAENLQRADFRKDALSEAVLVTTRKGFAIVLIVVGESDQVESMIRSAHLAFSVPPVKLKP